MLLGVRLEDGSFQIMALSLQTGEKKIVVEGGRMPRYSPTGNLVYGLAATGTLMVAPFDLERLEITGNSVQILQGVIRNFSPVAVRSSQAFEVTSSSSDAIKAPAFGN